MNLVMSTSSQKKLKIAIASFVVIIIYLYYRNRQISDFHKAGGSVPEAIKLLPHREMVLHWPYTTNPIPGTGILQKMSISEISKLYFSYVNTLQVFCPVKNVYGGVKNGWYTCDVIRKNISKPCVAYMIADENENTITTQFFQELKQDYHCEKNFIMKSTITAEPFRSVTVNTSTITAMKSKNEIDFMAIDVGGGETGLLAWMLKHNVLKNVNQLLVNFHGITSDISQSIYVEHLMILSDLYTEGFRTFHFQRKLNCIFKEDKGKTGCYSIYMIRQMPMTGPLEVYGPDLIENKTSTDLAFMYSSLLISSQVHCKELVRLGKVSDGGWDVCNDTKYRLSSPCLVYSFGIDNDWSFDDDISTTFGCETHSFDPSMGMLDHQRSKKITFHNIGLWGKPRGLKGTWTMMNLKEIIDMLGHTGKIIDILKMDIEWAEWEAIPNMLATGVLRNVRQLFVEFHGSPDPDSSLLSRLTSLRGIYDQGFKLFWSHPNVVGDNPKIFSVTGREVSGCYENYFLNTNLINLK